MCRIKGFFSGLKANVFRNALDSSIEIATYFHAKELILKHRLMTDSFPLHIVCGIVSVLKTL